MPRYPLAVLAAAALLAACDSNPNDPGEDPCEDLVEFSIGQTLNGSLTARDCELEDGSFIDLYGFTLGTTREVTLTQRSNDFDSFLFLFGSDGEPITSDDDSDPETEFGSRITITLPPGSYVVGANSVFRGETGSYQLSSD